MKNFTCVQDIGSLKVALDEAFEIKKDRFKYVELGKNKTLMMIFFNSSLRTRLSTQKAAMNLGMFTLGRITQYCHLHTISRITPHIAYNCPFIFFYNSPYQSTVFTLGGLIVKLQSKIGFRIGCFGYHQESRRIFINTVYQPHMKHWI